MTSSLLVKQDPIRTGDQKKDQRKRKERETDKGNSSAFYECYERG